MFRNFYNRILIPFLLSQSSDSEQMIKARSENLHSVHGKVMEIGFGAGFSLACYPSHLKSLTATDYSPALLAKAEDRIKQAHLDVDCLVANAEQLPFPDQSFDCVVSHLTLCSIENIDVALKEIKRVLKDGGTFHFLEHGACHEKSIKKWQDRFNPIQRFIGGGCNCNRPIDHLIENAGFAITGLKNYHMGDAPKFLDFMYQGIAVKNKPPST